MQQITLKLGNILDKLKTIPDNSVDCIVTSPPYYGLRKYKAPDVVWGGDPACEHEWQEVPQDLLHENRNNRRGTQEEVAANPTGTTYIRKLRGQPHGVSAKVGNQLNDAQPPELPSGAICSKCSAWRGQLGLEPDYHQYLDHLLMVTAEIKRVLKPTGTLWWNMGDSYANGDIANMLSKSLMQLPTRFAIRMADEQGWILRNTMIWYKRNHMPSSVKDRLANSYEYVFFFTKQKRYFFNLDAVRVPNKVVGVTDMRPPNVLRQKLYQNSSYNKSDDPHLAQFKAENKSAEKSEALGELSAREARAEYVSYERKQYLTQRLYGLKQQVRDKGYNGKSHDNSYSEAEANVKGFRKALELLQSQEHLSPTELVYLKDYVQNHVGHPLGKNPGDVLELTTQPFKGAHFATFPPKLPEFCIKAGSPEDGVVLDPFAGSGTTMQVARQLGRNAIGIEISQEYAQIIKKRLGWGCGLNIEWKED